MIEGRSDVLVVGAGPAGAAAAIEAVRAGAKVCVVDRARFPRPKTCGDAVSNEAVRVIEELGASAAFEKLPRAVVEGAAAIFPDGSRVRRSYGARPGYIVGRFDLDAMLRRAAESAGAGVLEGIQVRHLLMEDGRAVGAEGDEFRWRADAIVAADGPGSVAWSALGLGHPGGAGMGIAITAYYEGLTAGEDDDYSEHYFEHDLPCGYGWIFPPVDGVSNIGVYQRVDRYRRNDYKLRELLDRFVERHASRFAQAKQKGAVRSWSLPLATRHLPPGGPGLFTCGDAGRLIDPLTGEGIWQALHSGRLAGRAAARAARRRSPGTAAVRRYQLACAREIAWPSGARVSIQHGMEWIVDLELYRSAAVRGVLRWGYGNRALEVSKRVGG